MMSHGSSLPRTKRCSCSQRRKTIPKRSPTTPATASPMCRSGTPILGESLEVGSGRWNRTCDRSQSDCRSSVEIPSCGPTFGTVTGVWISPWALLVALAAFVFVIAIWCAIGCATVRALCEQRRAGRAADVYENH